MPEIIRAETEAKEDVDEQAVSLTPGVVAYDPLVEPPYGWVVCISMHVINAFTWGIIAVRIIIPSVSAQKVIFWLVVRRLPVLLYRPRCLPQYLRL